MTKVLGGWDEEDTKVAHRPLARVTQSCVRLGEGKELCKVAHPNTNPHTDKWCAIDEIAPEQSQYAPSTAQYSIETVAKAYHIY